MINLKTKLVGKTADLLTRAILSASEMSIAFIIMHYAYVVFSVLWHSFTVVCREHQRQSRAHSLLCYKLPPILKADQCSGSYHQLTMDHCYRASQSHRRRLLLRIQCTSCLISKWTAVSPGRGRCHIDGCSVSVPITSTASRTSWNDMSSGSSCYTLCRETRPTLVTVPCAVHWRGDVSGSRLTIVVAAPAAIRQKDLDAVVAINRCRRYRRKSCCSVDAFHLLSIGPSVLWRCWLSGRKGIWPVKKLSGAVLAWLSVWSEVRFAYGPADAAATHCLLLQ